MRYDAIVIGAGMSGLAAAIRLAQFDRRVVLLERHELWGGLNSFYTLGGRRFDVGLHALTNWAPPGQRGSILGRVLRQLRVRREELKLGEQRFSEILLPGLKLTFTNDVAHLQEEVARAFPMEADRFARLTAELATYDVGDDAPAPIGARAVLAERLNDPLLAEALLLPITYYCSPSEDDCDWHAFAILFRSMFLEGLHRPEGGVRTLLNALIKRYKRTPGELRMKTGVRRVRVAHGAATGVELDDGEVLEADHVFSSAGYVETMRLCGEEVVRTRVTPEDEGRISFLECLSVLDRPAKDLGHGAATSFFCLDERLAYRVPDDLCDVRSGVISAPENFASAEPLPEGILRATVLANHRRWCELGADYAAEKERWADRAVESAGHYNIDWRPHTVFRDVFTPRTIQHYTGHLNGAVYGSPVKRRDGATGIEGLHLLGTDQGYLGVVGALYSGVAMANRHGLAVPA